jgi:elongation factor G
LDNFEKIRNFGFIAHIDAGKTTTTERVLYVTGANYKIGEVDEGTTTTDWMEEEKERGITITAAAVSAVWKDHVYHIIDTPGHVDFTAEVQRSLRVLDGVVVVLCGVAGVQTQTETVWKQADNFNIPRIAFINKLDRIGANFENVLKEIDEKLKTLPLPLNIPFYKNDALAGVIDLVRMKKINFNDNSTFKSEEEIPEICKEISSRYRENLINILTQFDDKLLEYVLEEKLTDDHIHSSIRSGSIKRNFIPVLCGASFRNVGIPPLLDAINLYLPSPNDIKTIKGYHLKEDRWDELSFDSPDPVLYIFKVQFHREKGPLAFTRIYSGKIKQGDAYYNPRTKKRERIQDLLKVFGNDFERIASSEAGDIVIIVGTKDTVTGDTLCSEGKQVILERLTFPEPVIHIRIEPKNSIDQEKFNTAKSHLLLEDPTINCKEDPETGQTLVGGMGELHIEIFLERIKKEYGVDLKSGQPQVVYRETPKKAGKYSYEFDKKISGNVQHASITMSVEPRERNEGNSIAFNFKNKLTGEENTHLENGIKNALLSGPESAYPVVDCRIMIEDLTYDRSRSSPLALEACANICMGFLLRETGTILLEPIMKVEIEVPENFTGAVIGELQSRNGVILDIIKKVSQDKIMAKSPLKQMFGYTTDLRSLTQGKGSFSMQFLEFDRL